MHTLSHRNAVRVAALWLISAAAALADTPQQKFERAYFLAEHKQDFAAAQKLYAEVAADSGAEAVLRTEAKTRAASCREEAAASDLATLMPATAWAYVQLDRPSEQVLRLLDQLGLLRGASEAGEKAAQQLAISPELVQQLLGIRGIAACVTGVDAAHGRPAGVAVIHPGKLDVIRALLETALPVQFKPSDAIEGFATYEIEGIFVTLTNRLIIVSPSEDEIEGVVRRLGGDTADSLTTNAEMAAALKERTDSLVFAAVNFKPLLPIMQAGIAAAAAHDREVAMVTTLADIRSLKTFVFRLGVANDGIFASAAIDLEKGHHNVIFNLLRLPPVDQTALRYVPAGSAAFLSFSLNPASKAVRPIYTEPEDAEAPPVSLFDIGREVFGNVIGVTLFTLPSTSPIPGERDHMPDAAAIFTVNDPKKSIALWEQFLGIANLAGSGSIEGAKVTVGGATALKYTLPETDVAIYLATRGNALVVTPSQTALESALTTMNAGKSIADDPAFSHAIAQITPDSSMAAVAHAGRCMQLASGFMNDRESKEVKPFMEMASQTVGAVVFEHSATRLGFAMRVTGLPKVGPMVAQFIEMRRSRAGFARRSAAPMSVNAARTLVAERPADGGSARAYFDAQVQAGEDATAAGQKLATLLQDDARGLNEFAWQLLTEPRYHGGFNDLAMRCSARSNELTQYSDWMYVDTLAHAYFAAGDRQKAIELEQQALVLCGDDSRRGEAELALRQFQGGQSPPRTNAVNAELSAPTGRPER